MAALYALAIAILTAYGANLLWLSYRHAAADGLREGVPPGTGASPDPPAQWPRVTVQLPLYNEPLVAERLIDSCAQLDYPRALLEVQILDDSSDETSGIAADRALYWQRRGVDVVHVRRLHRTGYKAGALANGLRLATGDYIAIFDADFVPESGFLRQVLPAFSDDRIGLVQARWGHLNAGASLLTRLQSVGLDTHFAVEQRARYASDCFLSFNGTAGVWRRPCIEEAGGWQADTIAEDLDLSYRAQLAGWRFKFLDEVEVPAELPSTMAGLRTQQFRWAKGSVETASKLLRPLWHSDASTRRKVQGSMHLTGHLVFPFVLLAAILHAPLLAAHRAGGGPGEFYFGWMALGLFGFVGFGLAQLLGQRSLYVDWPRRLGAIPAFMAGTIGLSISNTRAVLEALLGKRTPFVRTPKFGDRHQRKESAGGVDRAVSESSQLRRALREATVVHWLEACMLAYSLAGVWVLVSVGEWTALPFQLFFAAGFGLVVAASFRDEPDPRHMPRCDETVVSHTGAAPFP